MLLNMSKCGQARLMMGSKLAENEKSSGQSHFGLSKCVNHGYNRLLCVKNEFIENQRLLWLSLGGALDSFLIHFYLII
jgi:hypothetical protein